MRLAGSPLNGAAILLSGNALLLGFPSAEFASAPDWIVQFVWHGRGQESRKTAGGITLAESVFGLSSIERSMPVLDLVFVTTTIGFFAVAWAYVIGCDRL